MALEVIKKIDVHEHCILWPEYSPKYPKHNITWVTAEELIENYCDKLNVEKCVLLPIASPEAQTVGMPNEMIKFIVDKYPDRFFWFCNVDPRALKNKSDSNLGYLLEFYRSLGAKGVGEITSNIYADDPRLDNLFSYCEELDMPVTIHIAPEERGYYGIIDELGLPRIEKMLKKHPKLKIFGHSQCFWSEIGENNNEIRGKYVKGKVQNGRLPELMREYENLYCDLSAGSGANALMRDRDHAARFIEEFPDRLLYGSDVCLPISTFPFEFDKFLTSMRENGEISEENYRKLVRDNACRLLDIT